MGRITNAVICAARDTYYRHVEPWKLKRARYWEYDSPLRTCFWTAAIDPLVSCYVPTHSRADLLIERSLKSILAQTYTNIEVIVVADNCTDDTVQRVWDIASQDPRVFIVETDKPKCFPHKAENYWFAGRADPSNVGLKYCKGAFIATNDDDDVWMPDHIEQLLRFAQKGNYEFVSGGSSRRGADGHRTVKVPPYAVNGILIGGVQTWLYRAYLKSFKFNRQCWRKRVDRVCDVDLQDRFVRAGVRMGYFPETVTEIVVRPGETQIGLKAYLADPAKTEAHFAPE